MKLISKTNKVIFSHLENAQDFFDYEPNEKWDCIISNPLFKNKRQFFERASQREHIEIKVHDIHKHPKLDNDTLKEAIREYINKINS